MGFVDGGVDILLEGLAVFEDGVATGEAAHLEELLLREVPHALPIYGQLAEPPHEVLTAPRWRHVT